jgi:O-antigen chain-terminating methyltransferase
MGDDPSCATDDRASSWRRVKRWIDRRTIGRDPEAEDSLFAVDGASELRKLSQKVARQNTEIATIQRELAILRRQNISLRILAEDEAKGYRQIERETPSRQEVDLLRNELAIVLQRLGTVAGSGADINYVGFEDRLRGSSEDLREAQRRYVSLFPHPSDLATIVDVGCGRGEMVELLIEAGHRAIGIDTDADMVKVCQGKEVPVVQDDGVHYLEGLSADSLKGVFCAQVVEHLLTAEMERLLRLAYQCLKPSGVLVVETINPRSLYAIGNHFLADTTHVRPVHPETLRYICEQIGFTSVALEERSLHELAKAPDGLADGKLGEAVSALLRNVFGYQDYIIVATK